MDPMGPLPPRLPVSAALANLKARRPGSTRAAAAAPAEEESTPAAAPAGRGAGGAGSAAANAPRGEDRGDAGPSLTAAARVSKVGLGWHCGGCERECLPIRDESRCLCGHRLREHAAGEAAAPFKCGSAKCKCKAFFYIVAEGSWTLRCRCKHKATEHDAATHACSKPACGCDAFFSPWVCNCNHPWAAHEQRATVRVARTLEELALGLHLPAGGGGAGGAGTGGGGPPELAVGSDVNRWDQLKRGEWD